MIGSTAEHDTIDVAQLPLNRIVVVETSVQHDSERRKIALQLMHDLVAERRNLAILLGRKSLQHCVSCVDDEHIAACARDGADKIANEAVVIFRVETDPMLDGHGKGHGIA